MPGVAAAYMGFCVNDAGGQIYKNQLTDGLWLLWEFQTRYGVGVEVTVREEGSYQLMWTRVKLSEETKVHG